MRIDELRKRHEEIRPGVFAVGNKGETIRRCQTCEEFTRFEYNVKINHSRCKLCGNYNMPKWLVHRWQKNAH